MIAAEASASALPFASAAFRCGPEWRETMLFRRRTIWFKPVFGEMVSCRPPDHDKNVFAVRTMRGVWEETW